VSLLALVPVYPQVATLRPTPLNTNARTDTGADLNPQITTDGAGNWIGVWSSTEDLNGATGTDADILVARSTDHGRTWSSPALLNSNGGTDTGGDQLPVIKTDGHGRWIVLWQSTDPLAGTLGPDLDVLYSISTNLGTSWSPPQPLNSNATVDTADDRSPTLDTDGKGAWIAAWHASNTGAGGTDQEVFYARSTDDGASWSPAAALNSNASLDSGDDFGVSLATAGAGVWIATWSSTDDLGAASDFDGDLAWARSVDNGATWSAPAFLNSNAATDDGEDFNSQVRTDGRGTWLVVWESGASLGGTVGTDQDILGIRSTDNGTTWSAPVALNSTARADTGLDSYPSVATDRAGRWIVAWHSEANPGGGIGTDADILVAYSRDNASSWSAPAPLAANAASGPGADTFARVETDGRGVWLVVWASNDTLGGTVGNDGDVLAASVTDPFLWSAPALLNANAATDQASDFGPRPASDGSGNRVAVWHSTENLNGTAGTDGDIFVSTSADNGRTWTAPALLNSNGNTDTGLDRDPSIATDRRGLWIAVWTSNENLNGQLGTDSDILFSRSLDEGRTWSAPAAVDPGATTDTASDFSATLVTDRSGNWVVAWTTQGGTLGNDFDDLSSSSTNHGVTWSAAVPLNSNAATDDGDDFAPRLATDEAGSWIAVWMSNDSLNNTIGQDDDILVAYSTDNGARWTAPRPLNANAATDGVDDDDYNPKLATDRAGNWIAVWHSESTLGNTIGPDFDILLSRSTNNGVNWSAVQPLNANADVDTAEDIDPEIATDEAGRWVVVWSSDNRAFGGLPGTPSEKEVLISRSADRGESWSYPAALTANAVVDDSFNASPAINYGTATWTATWASAANLLGADYDIRFANAVDGTAVPVQIPAAQLVGSLGGGGVPGTFVLTWLNGAPPFQVQRRGSLSQGGWIDTGPATCERTATFPLTGTEAYFRVNSLGTGQSTLLAWSGTHSYLDAASNNAVAETIFIAGFGLDSEVDVLTSGNLPLRVRRTLINKGSLAVAAGYRVREEVRGWTFLARGGDAGYLEGSTNQIVFSCETTATPALAPGQSAVIEFVLGGPGCPPGVPIAALPCGLYREVMTVDSPAIVGATCSGITPVEDGNFFFINEPNHITIDLKLNPTNDPDAVAVDRRRVWVFANGARSMDQPFTVPTHEVNITTSSPGFAFYVRARMPITGPAAPTVGTFAPAIPQAPAAPAVQLAPLTYNYLVTVVPAHNAKSACNVIGIPIRYEEKVDTTITAISTNGCAIAQRSILATGIYECDFQ